MSTLEQFRSALHNAVPYINPYIDLEFDAVNVSAGWYYGPYGGVASFPAGVYAGSGDIVTSGGTVRAHYAEADEVISYGFYGPMGAPAQFPNGADTLNGYGYKSSGGAALFPLGVAGATGADPLFSPNGYTSPDAYYPNGGASFHPKGVDAGAGFGYTTAGFGAYMPFGIVDSAGYPSVQSQWRQLQSANGTTVADWSGTTPSGPYCALEIPAGYTIATDYVISRGVGSTNNYIDLTVGGLASGYGPVTVDWNLSQLKNSSGVAIDWSSPSGIGFGIPILDGIQGTMCIDPVGRRLYDNAGVEAMHWTSARYVAMNGISAMWSDNGIDFVNGHIGAMGSATRAIDFYQHWLNSYNGFMSLDWEGRTLRDASGVLSMDWNSRQLLLDSVTVMDWNSGYPAADTFKLNPLSVGSLNLTPAEGMECYVNDADTPTIGSAVVGGGSGKCKVLYNGTAWIIIAVV